MAKRLHACANVFLLLQIALAVYVTAGVRGSTQQEGLCNTRWRRDICWAPCTIQPRSACVSSYTARPHPCIHIQRSNCESWSSSLSSWCPFIVCC